MFAVKYSVALLASVTSFHARLVKAQRSRARVNSRSDRCYVTDLPFVARTGQLERAQKAVIQHYQGWAKHPTGRQPSVVIITGQRGTGKTRFGEELLRSLAASSPLKDQGAHCMRFTAARWREITFRRSKYLVIFIDDIPAAELPAFIEDARSFKRSKDSFVHFVLGCEELPEELPSKVEVIACKAFEEGDSQRALERMSKSPDGVWMRRLLRNRHFALALREVGPGPGSVSLLVKGFYEYLSSRKVNSSRMSPIICNAISMSVRIEHPLPTSGDEAHYRQLFVDLTVHGTRVWPLQYLPLLVQRANVNCIPMSLIEEMLLSVGCSSPRKWQNDARTVLLLRLNGLHVKGDAFDLKTILGIKCEDFQDHAALTPRSFKWQEHPTQFLREKGLRPESLAPGILWQNKANGLVFDFWFVLEHAHQPRATVYFVQCQPSPATTKLSSSALIASSLLLKRKWNAQKRKTQQLDLDKYDVKFLAISNRELKVDHKGKDISGPRGAVLGHEEKELLWADVVVVHKSTAAAFLGAFSEICLHK